jgi:hypothetical protein
MGAPIRINITNIMPQILAKIMQITKGRGRSLSTQMQAPMGGLATSNLTQKFTFRN